jgi:hypothetical protein
MNCYYPRIFPHTVFRLAMVSESCPATPKSASLATPSPLSKILPALISLNRKYEHYDAQDLLIILNFTQNGKTR